MPNAGSLVHNGRIFEQAGNLERALASYRAAANEAIDASLRSTALRRQSIILRERCDWSAALTAINGSADAAKTAGMDDLLADAVNVEAGIHMARGDFDAAIPLFEGVLNSRNSRVRGAALQNLGSISAIGRDFTNSQEFFVASFAAYRRAGYLDGMNLVTSNYGAAALDQGDFELAEAVSLRAIDTARAIHDFSSEMIALKNYAESLIGQGKNLEDAETRAVIALGFFAGAGNAGRRIECLRLLGDLAVMRDDWRAARLAYLQALDLARRLELRTEEQRLAERLDLLSVDGNSTIDA